MQSKPPTPPTAPPHRDVCPPHTGRETSGGAIAALVLGVCGITVVPLICSVLALVFGYRARREIDRPNGTIGGRNYATAGIVLGWVGVAVVAAICVAVLVEILRMGNQHNDFWDSTKWDAR